MKKNSKICPICNEGNLCVKEEREEFQYKGKTFYIENFPVLACESCGEKFLNESKMKPIEKEIKKQHKIIDNLLSSEEIKEIRHLLGLSKKDLSNLLGGGEKGFSRYENGSINQSKSMDNLLRLLKQYPYLLDCLGKNNQPMKKHEYKWIPNQFYKAKTWLQENLLGIETQENNKRIVVPFSLKGSSYDEENRLPV